jgi:hypothetical protein
MLTKLKFLIILLLLETTLQIVFAAGELYYLNEFSLPGHYLSILAWQAKYIGTLKGLFCLPVYVMYYFVFYKDHYQRQTPFEGARSHAVIFFISYMLGFVILPFSLTFFDFIALPVISFICAFVMLRIFRKQFLKINRVDTMAD